MTRQRVLTENNFYKCVLLNGGDCDQALGKAETSEGLNKVRDEGAMDCGTAPQWVNTMIGGNL